jgi:hypothetical protein
MHAERDIDNRRDYCRNRASDRSCPQFAPLRIRKSCASAQGCPRAGELANQSADDEPYHAKALVHERDFSVLPNGWRLSCGAELK